MTLSSYSTFIVKLAASRGYTEDDIAALVKYSERLTRKGLPVIFDVEHLSLQSSFKTFFLYGMANSPYRSYREFTIPKRNGDVRRLLAPMPDLKILQRWIADEILSKFPVSKFAHAYRSGRSIKTNAKFHINRKYVVKFDINNFFESTKFKSVENLIVNAGYSAVLAKVIANILTYDGCLPQGAPSSPVLSNIIYYNMDAELGAAALSGGWRYTRYADDMTFSGDGDLSSLFSDVHRIVSSYKLVVNHEKTKVMRRGARQIICGVVVNETIGASREIRRKFLQEVYYIKKYGLSGHINRGDLNQPNYISSMIGRGNFLIWMSEHRPERLNKIKEAVDFLKSISMNDHVKYS